MRDVSPTVIYPNRIEDVLSTHSEQPITALSIKDLEGIADVWDNYIEFSSLLSPYEGVLHFSAPSIPPGSVISLVVSYRGPSWELQGLSFDAYNTLSAQYVNIGNTFYATEDTWSLFTFVFPETLSVASIIANGDIKLRLKANVIGEEVALDFVQLTFSNQLPPTPAPWVPPPSTGFTTAGSSTTGGPTCSTQGYVFAPHQSLRSPPARTLPSWMYGSRVAHAGFAEDALDPELNTTLVPLLTNGVTVAEVDNVLSDYGPASVFDNVLRTSRRWSTIAHNAGLASVLYYPALEIITHGTPLNPGYAQLFPDEVQVGVDGRPNIFYYPQVFWLAPGDESAWLSPNGPYRQKYIENVKQLAQTGADGLWMDVPVYFDTVVKWNDFSHWAASAFKTDTGLDQPKSLNWNDPVWRRWVSWRHDNIRGFLLDVARQVQVVSPAFQFIIETYVCDYHDATLAGYDGAYLRKEQGLTVVWEVSATSDSHGMRYSYEDDWAGLIAMYKYGRGAVDYSKPSWAFCYGIQSDDALSVMAEAIVAGNAPYEVRTPGKEEGVPGSARSDMFTFINRNVNYLYDTVSAARVAIFHSTPSRDYVDHGEGNGMFCSMGPPASLRAKGTVEWYSDSGGPESDSCYRKQWIGEYRGMVKALINSHIPFNILPSPGLEARDLDPYKVILLPDVQAISDAQATLFKDFVRNGGVLILTGGNPTGFTEYGDSRPEFAFYDLLGISKSAATKPDSVTSNYGQGRVTWYQSNVGWDYIRETQSFAPRPFMPTSANYNKLIDPILASFVPQITLSSAHRCIHMEANQRDDKVLVLQFTNFVGICESNPETRTNFPIVNTRFSVSVNLYSERAVASVKTAAPGSPVQVDLPFTRSGAGCNSHLNFDVFLHQYSIVVIELM